jgi:hypothetical protein
VLVRGPLILVAVMALLAVGLVVANALLTDRIEQRAAVAVGDAIAERTGERPERVRVELDGWPAAVRLVTGPAPDATVIAEGVPVPDVDGSLTRVRVRLSDVSADVGALTDGSDDLPFSADGGRFTATVAEADLNTIVGPPALIERLEMDDGVVRAELPDDPEVIRAGLPPELRASSVPEQIAALPDDQAVGVTVDVVAAGAAPTDPRAGGADGDTRPDGQILVLRPQVPGSLPGPSRSLLEQLALPVSLDVLPGGVEVEAVRIQDERLVGVGSIDVAALASSSSS